MPIVIGPPTLSILFINSIMKHYISVANYKCKTYEDYITVVYHTRISYRTRTVRIYAYGTTIRVWYGYLYHMHIALLHYYFLQATYSYC